MSLPKSERKEFVDKLDNKISISRQCDLIGVSRSAYYYESARSNEDDIKIKRLIDEMYLKHPFKGSRRISDDLKKIGIDIGRYRVRRLMREMSIHAIYPKKRITTKNEGHKTYPYLLKNLEINSPDIVWASDITYIPLKHGFAYLTAVMDWYSRYIISWELSMSLESSFCTSVLKASLESAKPDVFNTDQGCQYTSNEFIKVLQENQVWISMSGKGRAFDNIMIERLWRTLKYEEAYLKEYTSYFEAYESIGKYIEYYNEERRHSSLDKRTPKEAYLSEQSKNQATA